MQTDTAAAPLALAASEPPKATSPKFLCVPIEQVKPAKTRVRKHTREKHMQMRGNYKRFGQVLPILVQPGEDGGYTTIDGHEVYAAIKAEDGKDILIAVIDHLNEAEVKALRISLAQLPQMATWNEEVMRDDLSFIYKADGLLIHQTALPAAKVDAFMLSGFDREKSKIEPPKIEPGFTASRPGDLFACEGGHRIFCGDAKLAQSYIAVLDRQIVRLLLTDNPRAPPAPPRSHA